MNFDHDRFWSKVNKAGANDCWLWTGGRSGGYGQFGCCGRAWHAHAVAFAITHGIMPTNILIRHICNNKLCCNPVHLIDGTHAENKHDSVLAGTATGRNNLGIMHHNTLLQEEDIHKIRRLGVVMTAYQIAKIPEFKRKITESGIRKILQGQTWKEV